MWVRVRLALRSAVWELWRTVRDLPLRRGSFGKVDDLRDPPDRGADSEIRRLRLEHLLKFRGDAKVLTDRLRVTRGQLWGSGVPVGVTETEGGDVLMEFAGGTVLAARRVERARRPIGLRLKTEPTELPLLLG